MSDELIEWEECVRQVWVLGSVAQIGDAKGFWEMWLQRAASARDELHELQRKVGESFSGTAANAYQEQLDSLVKLADGFEKSYRPIVNLLSEAGESLAQARREMPIPDSMINQVEGQEQAKHDQGRAGVHVIAAGTALMTFGGSEVADGLFGDSLADTSVAKGAGQAWGAVKDAWNDRDDERTREANNALNKVNDHQANAVRETADPQGGPEHIGGKGDLGGVNPTGAGPSGGGAHAPKVGGGAGYLPSSSTADGSASHFDSLQNAPSAGHVGTDVGTRGSEDAPAGDKWTPAGDALGTGLAGAGDGGFQGASGVGGAGAGGFGIGASHLGASGLGGGGGAGGMSGGGVPSSGFGAAGVGVDGGLGGPGSGAGRGTAGAAGMVGGGSGAGASGSADEDRETWLTEDEDVWGANKNAGPADLGWQG